MTPGRNSVSLNEHKARLELQDCTCPHAWKGLGRLYGISFGKGWVRLSTSPECPEHKE